LCKGADSKEKRKNNYSLGEKVQLMQSREFPDGFLNTEIEKQFKRKWDEIQETRAMYAAGNSSGIVVVTCERLCFTKTTRK
jgi:hypothetical protein